MKNKLLKLLSILAIATLASIAARADEYQALMNYDWGQSRQPLVAIENNIRTAKTPAEFAAIGEQMVAVLQSEQSSYAAKQFACRICQRLADEACIPALGKLLSDPELSHMARFALQGDPSPEAGKVLRAELAKLEGDLLIGAIGTLSQRSDPQLVPSLLKWAAGIDTDLARAALKGLGNIATADVVAGLREIEVAENLRELLIDTRLKCADRMLVDGDDQGAAQIYLSTFETSKSEVLQAAALRGILLSMSGNQGIEKLVGLISGESPYLSKVAKQYLVQQPGDEIGAKIAATLSKVADDEKILLLDILKNRGDSIAMSEVAALLDDSDTEVRMAAAATLGQVGDASVVPKLISLACEDGSLADAAYASLKTIEGPAVAETLIAAAENADGPEKILALRVMVDRANSRFAPVIMSYASARDDSVRAVAIGGLGTTGQPEQLGDMVELILQSDNSSDKNGLLRAIVLTGLRSEDISGRAHPLCAALGKAESGDRILLIRALARLGGDEALAALIDQTRVDDQTVVAAAVGALAGWPTPAAGPRLLEIVKSPDQAALQTVALKGYINAANQMAAQSAAKSLEMYREALGQAKTEADMKSVLAGISKSSSIEAFEVAVEMLANESLRSEAELAVVGIAENAYQNSPAQVCEVLQILAEETDNASLRPRIVAVIAKAKKDIGFVRSWLVSGPYTGADFFDNAFLPESDEAEADWTLLEKGVGDQAIDLLAAIGGNNRAAYVKTSVWSPRDQKIRLSIGSDDGIKVWVNGDLVHANNVKRGVTIGQDQVDARLRAGWNAIKLKIVQHTGDWGFALRICDPDGIPLEELKFAADN